MNIMWQIFVFKIKSQCMYWKTKLEPGVVTNPSGRA